MPSPHLNKEATPVLELHCAQGWFGGGRHTDQHWPDTRSAYPDSQHAMRSAHVLGHSWRRDSGACLGHAKVTLMPRRNWHAKDLGTSFNGSQALGNRVSRTGCLSTKGHPCTAGKVRHGLPAWLYPG